MEKRKLLMLEDKKKRRKLEPSLSETRLEGEQAKAASFRKPITACPLVRIPSARKKVNFFFLHLETHTDRRNYLLKSATEF